MRRVFLVLVVLAFAAALGASTVSAGSAGDDGYRYAWFRDADGDGIPNGLDPDWVRPQDGTGYMLKHQLGWFLGVAVLGKGTSPQHQHRWQKKQPDPQGDGLRTRDRLRDGSCE